MAESAKRKSDAFEEHNEILAFSSIEAEGLPGTAQFFAALHHANLFQAFKIAWVATAGMTDNSGVQIEK